MDSMFVTFLYFIAEKAINGVTNRFVARTPSVPDREEGINRSLARLDQIEEGDPQLPIVQQIQAETPGVEQETPPLPLVQQIRKTSKGKECRPCTSDHFATCAGILSESLRFARADGMQSDEVQQRLALCAQEMNAWERWDAAPESFVALSDEDKDFLRKWLPKGRGFRHKLNAVESVEQLEMVAADAQRLHLEARKEINTRRQSPLAEEIEAKLEENFEEGTLPPVLTESSEET